jgi:hypothetical protein
MLTVESATAILNLITLVPEIYVRSVEILTEDCRVVGIRLLVAASLVARKLARVQISAEL